MRLISFDTETTGLDCIKDETIEIGAVVFDENGESLDRFHTFIRPEVKFNFNIYNNISWEMVKNSPMAREAFSSFRDFVGTEDCYLVAHNAQFDAKMLYFGMKKVQLNVPKYRFWDSLVISKFCATRVTNYKLQTLLERYDINPGMAHRAVDDAVALFNLIDMFIKEKGLKKVMDNSGEFGFHDMDCLRFSVSNTAKKIEVPRFVIVKYVDQGTTVEKKVRHMLYYKKKNTVYSLCREFGKDRILLELDRIVSVSEEQ
jgi:DNA polymerase III alpha subunit (gram-positive type)